MRWKAPVRVAVTLTVFTVVLTACGFLAQAFIQPTESDVTTTKLVTNMVTQYHISRKDIDDDVSTRLLKRYIDQLDPQKLYFTQADIDKFNRYKTDLDDMLLEGDVRFAYEAFDVYAARLKQRMEKVHEFIGQEHDFSAEESMVYDADDRDWAKSEAEVNDWWRQRVKYDLLTLKLDDTDMKEARERLHKRYTNIENTIAQTEQSEKLEMYLSALTHCFDPHSSYMSKETLDDFQIQMRLRLEGIGAALRNEDGFTTVAQIVSGGAAEKDGRLKVGDKIIGVAQGDEEFVDIVEMKLSKVVRYIRGKKGTVVRLQVKPKATPNEIVVYDLTREEIALTSSEVKGEIISTTARLGEDSKNQRIGVIHIPSFYRDFDGARNGKANFKSTSRDVRKVINDFEKQGGVDAIVVDLRMNGGGALSEAIEVTGLFINEGPVVMVKEQDGRIKSHNDTEAGVAWDGPLVVVCNRWSASASEIFAGAIQDYGRGVIVGDKATHGKGTVQNVMPVTKQLFRFLNPNAENRGALKLTINQFYRVNGDSTQNRGVLSDVVLPSLFDHMDLGESFLDNALEFDEIDAADHEQYGLRSNAIIKGMAEASKLRVAKNAEFDKIRDRIARYLAKKNQKTVTLNEAQLKKEREQDKVESKDEKEDEPMADSDAPIFPVTAYNDELLHITRDYLQLLEQAKTAKR